MYKHIIVRKQLIWFMSSKTSELPETRDIVCPYCKRFRQRCV
jgi:hypothetical protein